MASVFHDEMANIPCIQWYLFQLCLLVPL